MLSSLVACQSGGSTHPWKSVYVLCNLLIGIGLLVAFVAYEILVPAYPLLPGEIFRQRVIQMAFIIAFAAGMFYYSLTNFGPTYFSNVYNTDAITIGVRNIGFPTAVVVGAVFANALLSIFPHHISAMISTSCCLMSEW
jgi:MFS family permease